MTATGKNGSELEKLLEGARQAVRRSQELILQTQRLMDQCQVLMRETPLPATTLNLRKQALRTAVEPTIPPARDI